MSRENEITVHLVHHPGHVVFQANLCNSLQFFSCPDPADRVVRIALHDRHAGRVLVPVLGLQPGDASDAPAGVQLQALRLCGGAG